MPAASQKSIIEWLGRYFQEAWPMPESARHLAEKIKTAHSHSAVNKVLELADEMLNAHGVEPIRGMHVDNYYYDVVGLYVNMGDSYNPTLLYNTVTGKFVVTTLGDWVQAYGRKYQIE